MPGIYHPEGPGTLGHPSPPGHPGPGGHHMDGPNGPPVGAYPPNAHRSLSRDQLARALSLGSANRSMYMVSSSIIVQPS